MMNLKMKKLTAAVAAGLGASVVGMNAAQSDEILFPYVVASDTVTTIVSVVNDAERFTNLSVDELHYLYLYKTGSPPSNTAPCTALDFIRTSSPNDLVTFDVNDQFSGDDALGVLFEDPENQRNANYTARGQNFAGLRNVSKPVRATLLVDNNQSFATTTSEFDVSESLYGEAIVLEFGQGAAWGYRAYNAAGIYAGTTRTNRFDFSDRVETTGEVLTGFTQVTFLPFIEAGGEFNTRFFVTPVSTNQTLGTLTAQLRLAIADFGLVFTDFPVAYDRDENPISGGSPQSVVCVGAVDAASLLTQPVLFELATGGWSNLGVVGGTGQAVVFKLEFNQDTGNGTFNGQPLPGVFNNAVWLRKGIRESLPRPLTINTQMGDINAGSATPGVAAASDD